MGNPSNQITGSRYEAEKWIMGSPLAPATKEALLRFVHKFPTLNYYKVKNVKAQHYPEWFRTISETLRGFMPNMLIWVQFDAMGRLPSEHLASSNAWYHRMFTTEVSSEFERLFFGGSQLLVLYGLLETLESMLAIKLGNTDDQAIYEFHYGSIAANSEGDGVISPGALHIAFNSYSELLDHIVAIRLENGETIHAIS